MNTDNPELRSVHPESWDAESWLANYRTKDAEAAKYLRISRVFMTSAKIMVGIMIVLLVVVLLNDNVVVRTLHWISVASTFLYCLVAYVANNACVKATRDRDLYPSISKQEESE